MSIVFSQTLPIALLATIRPGVAPARAECSERYRERPAQKPWSFDVMKDARVARSPYQRKLLRQFMTFLVSRLPFARPGSIRSRIELGLAEASARN